jgi:hypothetical protein
MRTVLYIWLAAISVVPLEHEGNAETAANFQQNIKYSDSSVGIPSGYSLVSRG